MKKICRTLFLLFIFKVSIAQQWYPVPGTIGFGPDISSVAVINRNFVFAAGGLDQPTVQSLFRSADYGLNWNVIFDNVSANPWIKSVVFADTLHGFAVGYNGTLKKSVAGYTSWLDITSPAIADFNKVCYAGPQTLFAVGRKVSDSTQVIVKSTNGGSNWSISLNQPGKCLRSVCFTDTLNGVAVGDSGTILKTVNGGNSWVSVVAPVQRNFNGIAFTNATIGFIVGGKQANDSIQTILRTIDGGSTWTIIKDVAGAWLTDITFASLTTAYAVGDKGTIIRTTDIGQNWTLQQVNQGTGNEHFTSVKFADPSFGVIGVANPGKVFIYTDALLPEVDTVWGFYRDSTTYVVKGHVNTHGTPTQCYFEFSTSNNFSPLYYTYNQYITSDTFKNAEIFLQGLTPNTTYYYRFVVKSILGTQYFDTLSFYTYTPRQTVTTYPVSSVTLSSAALFGTVNKCIPSSFSYFIYGVTSDLQSGSTIHTVPPVILDTLLHSVWAYVSGLQPNTNYYYTLAIQTPYGIVTGDTLSFFTSQPSYTFQTDSASNITESSATVFGEVKNLPQLTNLFFEYGTTSDFGDSVIATPALVNDTAYHSVSAILTSLVPYTTYYYRLRGNSGNTIYFGSPHSFFTNYNHFNIQTLSATGITMTTAVMQGNVDKFLQPAQLSFQYGPTPSMGQTLVCSPASVSDSLAHNVSALLTGLMPGTRYYYYLKAETSVGTFYGPPLSFFTSNPYSFIQTDPATGINNTSAQLNGSAAGFPAQTTVNFEYGATAALGSQVAASPSFITDTLEHSFTAYLSGMSPGHTYYYRLKGNALGVDFYGQIRQLYIGNSEIPNWDFQYWQQDTFKLPDAWNIAGDGYAQVPGHAGNYALRLSGQTFTLLGIMDDSKKNGGNGPGFFGGVPLAGRPDSVSVYANVSFAPGDTGMMVIYLHKDTTSLAFEMFKLTGNSGGAFKNFTFPISYPSGLIPDSVVIALLPINLDGNNSDPNDFIEVDDISFSPGQMQIYNGDLEHWFDFAHKSLLDWTYNKHILVNQSTANDPYLLNQTLFNSPTDYAVELRNVYAYNSWWNSELNNRSDILNNTSGGFPVNTRHQTLNGYYKWFPVNGDTLKISVEMFANGQSMGQGMLQKTDSVSQFTALDIPIYYYSPLAYPDEAHIQIISSQKPAKGPSRVIIDKLSFDGFTSIDDNVWVNSTVENGLRIYPNPTKDRVVIEIESNIQEGDFVQLFDLNGQLMNELRLLPNQSKVELNLVDLTSGFYLLNVKAGNRLSNGKIVVVK